jgi:integrase
VPNFALTDIAIRRLPKPEKGTVTYWDRNTKGLGLRISQGGAKTFIVLVGSGKRHKIGRYPNVSLQVARVATKRTLGEVALGKYLPKTISFEDAKTLFLDAAAQRNRPRTVADYRRLLTRHFPFGRRQLGDISTQDIATRIERIKDAPFEASHALVAAKVFFRWLQRRGHIQNDPCSALQAPTRLVARERVLSDKELGEVLAKAILEPFPFGPIVMLLILTGQRRGEIASLQWTYIDTKARSITLPAAVTKNRRQHTFPFGDAVAEILETVPRQSDFLFPASRDHVRGKPTTVFNGWPKSKANFDKKLESVAPWTLHDLRRTFSSSLAALGVAQVVVEKLLNHVSGGALSPIAQVYNRHSYMNEMRTAVADWEAKLASLAKS